MAPCKSGLLPEGLPCINNNIEIEIEIEISYRQKTVPKYLKDARRIQSNTRPPFQQCKENKNHLRALHSKTDCWKITRTRLVRGSKVELKNESIKDNSSLVI